MKAIRVTTHGGPEVLKFEEVAVPEPGPEQVLVRVRAAGVNPVDTYIRAGAYSISNLPYTPGFDAAGEIEKCGPQAGSFKKGDRVYTSGSVTGTYAEFALCNANTVHKLPAKIAFAQGAGLGVPYATAYRALFHKGRAIAGEMLLVHGASGGVGTAAVQLARAAGLTIVGTSGTEKGRELVLANGAHHALDHSSGTYTEELMRLTENRGVDL